MMLRIFGSSNSCLIHSQFSIDLYILKIIIIVLNDFTYVMHDTGIKRYFNF